MSKCRCIGVFVFGLVVGMVGLMIATSNPHPSAEGFRATHPAISEELLTSALTVREQWHVKKDARVFILPHHVVAAKEIASLISAMERPSVVYLLSPDHFTRGKTVFTTSDVGLAKAVAGTSVDDAVIQREHGVSAITPFFAQLHAGVPVVPILVRMNAATSSRESLARELLRRLRVDPRAALVASIDFSHYLPVEVADFHDILAEDVLRAVAAQDADSVELDSPGALAVTLSVARGLDLGDVTIHAHTNSLRLLRALAAKESTSHFFVSFARGEMAARRVRTILRTNALNIKSQENRYYHGMSHVAFTTSTIPTAIGIVERDGVEGGRVRLPIVW